MLSTREFSPARKSVGIQEKCQVGLREGAGRDWPEVPQVGEESRLPLTLEIPTLSGEAGEEVALEERRLTLLSTQTRQDQES